MITLSFCSFCEGDITSKYMAIRSVISKYLPLPTTPVPGNNTKKAYGSVQLSFVSFSKIGKRKTNCSLSYRNKHC
jgi:hypothetical protein